MYRKFRSLSMSVRFITIIIFLSIIKKILLYLAPFVPTNFLNPEDLFTIPFVYVFFSNKIKYNPTLQPYFQANRINPIRGNKTKIISTSILFLLAVMLGKIGKNLDVLPWVVAVLSILAFTSSFYITNYSSYILSTSFLYPILINNTNYSRFGLYLVLTIIVYLVVSKIETNIRQK